MSYEFWKNKSEDYTSLIRSTIINVLHPTIISALPINQIKKLLDFGCGDGKLIENLPSDISVSAYDISSEMLKQAEMRLGNRVSNYYSVSTDMQSNYFDAVVCSMVLVCIDNQIEYETVLKEIHRVLLLGGTTVLAITHPCFRQYPYSDFYTSYCKDQEFDYFNEGEPFDVQLHDYETEDGALFKDFHWTLSFTINKTITSGFKITKIIETKDDPFSENRNKFFSPFLLVVAEKISEEADR